MNDCQIGGEVEMFLVDWIWLFSWTHFHCRY